MRAEESEGIGVAGSEESVDLGVEARIAGSDRRGVLHGWALLRQGDGLRDVAGGGWTNELSPKPASLGF
jgi:hypothetical protein